MYNAWSVDARVPYTVCRLARFHGKKAGQSMQEEFDAVREKHPDWFTHLGVTDKDADMLTGELRDKGGRILNVNEIDRQAERKKENES